MSGNGTPTKQVGEAVTNPIIPIRSMKVVLLGDSGVGKSSILHRFVNDEFIRLDTTVGAAFTEFKKFEIWDTAGQERYRSLAPMYYRGAVAAVVAYDITNRKSFDGAKRWVQEVKEKGDPGIIVALAANKMDLADKREVSFGEADEYAKENGLFHMETSAKTNVNVKSLFDKIDKNVPAEKRPTEKASPVKKRSLTKEKSEEKAASSARSYFSSCCK